MTAAPSTSESSPSPTAASSSVVTSVPSVRNPVPRHLATSVCAAVETRGRHAAQHDGNAAHDDAGHRLVAGPPDDQRVDEKGGLRRHPGENHRRRGPEHRPAPAPAVGDGLHRLRDRRGFVAWALRAPAAATVFSAGSAAAATLSAPARTAAVPPATARRAPHSVATAPPSLARTTALSMSKPYMRAELSHAMARASSGGRCPRCRSRYSRLRGKVDSACG